MKQIVIAVTVGLALSVSGIVAVPAVAAGDRRPAAAAARQASEAEQQVRVALQAQHFAYWGKDTAAFARIAADEFYRIGQDGALTTKDQHLAAMQADVNLPMAPSFHDDVRIRVYAGTAVVTLRDHRPAVPIPATRSTYVFVNRGGTWQMVALHQTAVVP